MVGLNGKFCKNLLVIFLLIVICIIDSVLLYIVDKVKSKINKGVMIFVKICVRYVVVSEIFDIDSII